MNPASLDVQADRGSTSEYSAPVNVLKKTPEGENLPVPWSPVPIQPSYQNPHGGENPPNSGGDSPTNPAGASGGSTIK